MIKGYIKNKNKIRLPDPTFLHLPDAKLKVGVHSVNAKGSLCLIFVVIVMLVICLANVYHGEFCNINICNTLFNLTKKIYFVVIL